MPRSHVWRRKVGIALAVLLGLYFGLGALLHYAVFPEEEPPSWAYPRAGIEIATPTGERIRMLRSGLETGGTLAEFQLDVDPGGYVAYEHVHPHNQESFRIVEGTLTAVIDGEEKVVSAGETLVVPPGTPHQLFNRTREAVHTIAEIRPALEPIESLFMVQLAGLDFKPDFLQLMLFRQTYDASYPTSPPPAVQRALAFLLAPTARLLGYRSFYPEFTARFQSGTSSRGRPEHRQAAGLAGGISGPSGDDLRSSPSVASD